MHSTILRICYVVFKCEHLNEHYYCSIGETQVFIFYVNLFFCRIIFKFVPKKCTASMWDSLSPDMSFAMTDSDLQHLSSYALNHIDRGY